MNDGEESVGEVMSMEQEGIGRTAGRKRIGLAVLSALVVVGAVWGGARVRYARAHISTENAQVDGQIVPVLAKVGGYVQLVSVSENQPVERGAAVVVLDDRELRVRLSEAEADLAGARAAAGFEGVAGQAEADASASHARRLALEARLASARTVHDRLTKDLARVQELAGKRIASRQQLDAAEAAVESAAAEVTALEQDVLAARAAESSAGASSRAADARLARAEAALARARLELSYAEVTAPASGIVSRTQVEVGQLVQPGQPLAAVVGDSAVWVTANLKETETARVRAGQPVQIDVDAYPGCEVVGVVESMSPATGSKFALLPPDNATGNFTKVVQRLPVRIAVREGCGEQRPLRPGMSVVAHIDVR
ncbi:MAG: HlyD family secretion protein [Gemmatimonadota bacterium]